MKFYMLCIVFILFVVIAIIVYLYFSLRFYFFKDLGYICKVLKNNISFNKNDIDTILNNAYQQIQFTTKYIIKNLSKPNLKLLKREDMLLVSEFFSSLGCGDVDYEISNIKYYETIFKDTENQSKEDVKKKGSTYFKIIIGIGLIICILLI